MIIRHLLELLARPWLWWLMLGVALFWLIPPVPAAAATRCPGVRETFDRQFPGEVERYGFADEQIAPFVELWRSGRRPELPVPPTAVTVYAVPGKPYVVAFERGGCLIAFLAADRLRLRRHLGVELGWPA